MRTSLRLVVTCCSASAFSCPSGYPWRAGTSPCVPARSGPKPSCAYSVRSTAIRAGRCSSIRLSLSSIAQLATFPCLANWLALLGLIPIVPHSQLTPLTDCESPVSWLSMWYETTHYKKPQAPFCHSNPSSVCLTMIPSKNLIRPFLR